MKAEAKMSEKDKMVFAMMTDPNNAFMNQIKFGDDEAIKNMYEERLWHTIKLKKHVAEQITVGKSEAETENTFLNSLTE